MTRILDRIDDPADIRSLSVPELETLAGELRDYIVEVVSRNGGHLGAPLGVVELTLALHRVFQTPRDKIVWDVGHQAYAHKIITGRREEFRTIRKYGGLAGFPKRCESVYDAFGTGHASTSISAALGMAMARDMRGTDEKVVAVIGDGSMTGGLAYEALNNAGELGTDLLVVLNDNVMAINENRGALALYLNRLITAPVYRRLRDDVDELLSKIPAVGGHATHLVGKMKEGIKNLIIPEILFEELGFQYYGPIPGHDIPTLLTLLERVKRMKEPVLLHVITSKGKGVGWAEDHPEKFHGTPGGFDVLTGKRPASSGPPTYTEVFAKALMREAERDEKITAITAAMPSGTGLIGFEERFGERFFDVGIAEGHAVCFAAGLAAEGFKPVVAIYSTFLQRAYDQLIHDVAIQNLPVVLALDRGGIVGDDGETHQGQFDLAYLRTVPRMVVGTPRDEERLVRCLKTGLLHGGPFAFRYPRGRSRGIPIPEEPEPLPVGKGEIMEDGTDIFVCAWGPMVYEALEARKILFREGISMGVADMGWVKPMDGELIEKIAGRTGRIITIEEGTVRGGAGSGLLEVLSARGLEVGKIRLMGLPDDFVEHGDPEIMREKHGLTSEGIAATARRLIGEKNLHSEGRIAG